MCANFLNAHVLGSSLVSMNHLGFFSIVIHGAWHISGPVTGVMWMFVKANDFMETIASSW